MIHYKNHAVEEGDADDGKSDSYSRDIPHSAMPRINPKLIGTLN